MTGLNCCKYLWVMFFSIVLLTSVTANAGEQEMLLFASIDPVFNTVNHDEDDVEREDYEADVDFIYSYLNGDYHFFSEFLFSTEEIELERIQLGLTAQDQTIFWVGRFHSPGRYWNFIYHHGNFLQTSISRPFLEVVEDEGGIFPAHIIGIMLEKVVNPQGQSEIQFTASLGVTSVIKQKSLETFDLLNPESGYKPALDLRFAFLPDQFEDNQFGFTLGYADMPVVEKLDLMPQLKSVQQYFAAVFIDWKLPQWRLISSLAVAANQLNKDAGNEQDNFYLSYLQGEYMPDNQLTVFARLEDISDKNTSEYLSLFPAAIVNRKMLGIRLDLDKSQALSAELSRISTRQLEFNQYLLQWSKVFQ